MKSSDVARRAGVSRTTVSYVLNGREDVSIPQETRNRVIRAAREIGYRPNLAAQALASGRTQVVALWLPMLESSLYHNIVDRVIEGRGPDDPDVVMAVMGSLSAERSGRALVNSWPVDGILAMDGPEHIQALLESRGGSTRPPIVSMGPYYLGHVDHVGVDLYAGAREATEHLLERRGGRGRVAYLVAGWGLSNADGRRAGYDDAMQAAGRAPEYITSRLARREAVCEAMHAHVTAHGHPDGIFCFSDDMTIGAYRGLRDLGLRVPEDVALVGCDGVREAEYMDCPLSTVAQPIGEMCRLGWEFLRERIEAPDDPDIRHAILPARLVIRRSSGDGA